MDINKTIPGSRMEDFEGKTVVLHKSYYTPAFDAGRNGEYDRRFQVTGGFGCSPTSIGRAVFGSHVIDGEICRVDRGDIAGIAVHQVSA